MKQLSPLCCFGSGSSVFLSQIRILSLCRCTPLPLPASVKRLPPLCSLQQWIVFVPLPVYPVAFTRQREATAALMFLSAVDRVCPFAGVPRCLYPPAREQLPPLCSPQQWIAFVPLQVYPVAFTRQRESSCRPYVPLSRGFCLSLVRGSKYMLPVANPPLCSAFVTGRYAP